MFEISGRGSGGAMGVAALTWLALAATPSAAHDFWVEPSTFRPQGVSTVRLDLRVGEDFAGVPVIRRQSKIERFVVAGPQGEEMIYGFEGKSPAGFVPIEGPGLRIAGYRSQRSPIELPADRFENYLEAEGLTHAIALRVLRGQTGRPGREVYSRAAKSLILPLQGEWADSDDGEETHQLDRALGFPLELVLLNEPGRLAAGDRISIQVLYDGVAIQNIQVEAIPKGAPSLKLTQRSNQQGLVSFPIAGPGPWLIKAVHMVEAPAGIAADWESFWASLTFAVAQPTGLDGP